jgi:hypothetical protein
MKLSWLMFYVVVWFFGAWCVAEGVRRIAGDGWGLLSIGVMVLGTLTFWFRHWLVTGGGR